MKRVISVMLAAAMAAALCTACQPENTSESTAAVKEGYHTLYFKDSAKGSRAVATFYNSVSKESEDIEMTKINEDNDSVTFSCEGNVKAYNTAYITCDEKKTKEFAFNPCTSGWYNCADGLLPYTEGEEINYQPTYDEVTLDCNGYQKDIHVWKPDDYNASSEEKYATVYVLDGQQMAFVGKQGQSLRDCEVVTEQVRAMTAATGKKAIVVAVDTFGNSSGVNRNDELVPNLKEFGAEPNDEFSKMKGTDFAGFVSDTLVPYIQENYNVYIDALHTSVAGVSLGGLESFYLTMEYPEIFGTVGALSPSFLYFDGEVWDKYLSEKTFKGGLPFLYLYTGPAGGDTDPDVTEMYQRLKGFGYPADRMVLHFNENGGHNTKYWRGIFSEFLTAMMFQRVEPLQGSGLHTD